MSASTAVAPIAVSTTDNQERGHRIRLYIGYALAITLVVGIAAYGFNYYRLPMAERPFSDKHSLLKPTGRIGLNLGVLGFLLFCNIFLYPLRKHWAWLQKKGNSRHWLDIHILMGITAPFVIALHSSFKFQGLAGIAFWIMAAVAASGVIGRYVYGQVPRSLNAAELSMRELQDKQGQLAAELHQQRLIPAADLARLLRLPSAQEVSRMNIVSALITMVSLDFVLSFRVAALRRHALGLGEKFSTFGGFRRTHHYDLERAVAAAREQASFSKRILFLSRAQQVFHLWHVVHKPFSYSFAVLAVVHITIVMLAGYVPWR